MDNVDRRTQIAGHNRLELLLFRLGAKQRFGINVFKIKEVIQTPHLARMPNSNPIVKGVATIRGKTIPVLDLSLAISGRPLDMDAAQTFVVITEFNQSVQGFLVTSVDRIVNKNWNDMLPPPAKASAQYMTAVTDVDGEIVEVLDVERVLAEIRRGISIGVENITTQVSAKELSKYTVLIADDSMVARKQLNQILEKIGVKVVETKDGQEAYELLNAWLHMQNSPMDNLIMVISDIEMPRMDGYTLTTSIRDNPKLKHLNVVLHTSLSGVFNEALVDKVGANEFMSKYKPQELANVVVKQAERFVAQKKGK